MNETPMHRPLPPAGTRPYVGRCHCGKVEWQAELDLSHGGTRCNCSLCLRLGGTKLAIKPAAFRLLKGREHLSEYRALADSPNYRAFCRHCGVYLYGGGHVEEIGGDFVSVNLNTVDEIEVADLPVGYWDGRHDNWHAGLRDRPWPVHTRAA